MWREANKLKTAADENGWSVQIEVKEDSEPVRLFLVANRGHQEEISIFWEGGRLTVAPVYTIAGRQTKLRNASACVQQMGKRPDFSKVAKAKRAAIRRDDETQIDIRPDPTSLPWHGQEISGKLILKSCYGKQLTWRNTITGFPEVDRVVRSSDPGSFKGNFNSINYHISTGKEGRMVLNFLGTFGYRSVAVDEILRVG